MLVEINESTKLLAGIKLANKRRYYDAICLFAQLTCYESFVNRIVCLCHLSACSFIAADLYSATKLRFPERTLYADVNSYGILTNALLQMCENGTKLFDGTEQTDYNLLVSHDLPCEWDDDIDDQLNDASDEFLLFDDPRYSENNFYDVNSVEYFTYLRVNMEKYFTIGLEKEAKEFAKKLLAVNTKHMPTLEAQIDYVLQFTHGKKGLTYVKRLVKCPDASCNALCAAVEIVLRDASDDKLLSELLKMLANCDEITPLRLRDYVFLASEYLHDYDLAYQFATLLSKSQLAQSLEVLQLCACAFFNYGDTVQAKNFAYDCCKAAPDDALSSALYQYVCDNVDNENRLLLEVAPRMFFHVKKHVIWQRTINLSVLVPFIQNCSHFFVPKPLVDKAKFNLKVMLAKKTPQLSPDHFQDLEIVFRYLRMMACGVPGDYQETANLIVQVLSAKIKNKTQFYQFAKKHLFNAVNDLILNASLLSALICNNCKDDVYVLLQDSYYYLQLNYIDCRTEEFARVFSVCAVMSPIRDISRYSKSYQVLKDAVDLQPYNHLQIAFALFSMSERNFKKMPAYDFFSADMQTLYKVYCQKRAQQILSADE